MSRDTFLARVRQAAAAGRQYRVHVAEVPPDVGYVGAGPDPLVRLVDEVNAVGGQAFLAADLVAARQQVAALLAQHPAKSALCWEHPLLDRLQVPELLAQSGATVWSHRSLAPLSQPEQRAKMLACDVCISSVSYAVAETGTLAVCSAPGRERAGSLIAPVHIALVEPAQVLPDLFDLFAQLQVSGLEALPSNLTLITGPSKTGDIELTLTTGVHGPGKLYVIVLQKS